VKNGAEKEKNTPEAGNTLAYVHEEKKRVIRVLVTFFAFAQWCLSRSNHFKKTEVGTYISTFAETDAPT